ncbi:hypothetical protein DIPPA_26641 [Diplonema papillatum]|nr:hypothetical protein DIPPA_26641 [Diplonema papillatum]
MLRPLPPRTLKHRYYVLRHGESLANVGQIVCSTMENGVKPEYGLSALGREQATAAGTQLGAELAARGRALAFVSSPFSRTQETARLAIDAAQRAAGGLAVAGYTHAGLRERDFGDLELTAADRYGEVWAEDLVPGAKSTFRAEPAAAVWERVRGVVAEVEAGLAGAACVVLVAHGDVLQIAQCGMSGVPVHEHRSLPHLNQANWRDVTPADGLLPHDQLIACRESSGAS